MAPSIVDLVPAGFLFEHQDVQRFIKWQEENCDNFQPGLIRTSTEYCEFLNYRRGNEALFRFEVDKTRIRNKNPATACGHELHPSDILAHGYCPVCEVDMCLMFLTAIRKVFQQCGGPWHHSYHPGKNSIARKYWQTARLELSNLVSLLDISIKYEEKWERENSKDAGVVWTTNSATKAVRKAEMEHKYSAVVDKSPGLAHPSCKRKMSKLDEARAKEAKSRAKKHVTFAADTVINPARNNQCFHRSSTNMDFYRPGRHAAPLGAEWIDTSRVSSSIADILILKVYVTFSDEVFAACVADSSRIPLDGYQGILSNHPGVDKVAEWCNLFVETSDGRRNLRTFVKEADALVVLVADTDSVKNVFFSSSDDVEDKANHGDKDVDQTRWTCRAECGVEAKRTVTATVDVAASIAISEEQPASKRMKIDDRDRSCNARSKSFYEV